MSTKKPLTFRRFCETLALVPDARGALRPLQLYPAQRRFVDAIDTINPATGRRQYRRFLLSLPKKAGKSTLAAAAAVWALTSDDMNGLDREVIIVASDLGQSRDVVFTQCERIIDRSPALAAKCTIKNTEIVFRQKVRDPQTGGTFNSVHVLRALPQDVRGLHGLNAACTIIDESWVLDDFSLLEALAPSPARPSPITIFSSYAGLRVQARPGNPLFDIWHQQDDPALFKVILSGPDAWREIPLLSEEWVQDMRRQFATCPSKYQRLVENTWAASESALLTTAELQAATVDTAEPPFGSRGVTYAMGVDLGLTHDWTALVLGHVEPNDGRFTVDVVRTWRGAPDRPVPLAEVEDTIATLARRFAVSKIVLDQWQAGYLAERLRGRRVSGVTLTTIEPAKLDKLVTLLKDAFARRAIAIPRRERDLLEQLEWLEVQEAGVRNRRRDKLRFSPGGDLGAASHDDLVIALGLAIEVLEKHTGRATLPPMTCCWQEQRIGRDPGCWLWAPMGTGWYPPNNDPICSECPGNVAARQMFQGYLARGGQEPPGGIREWLTHHVKDNNFTNMKRYQYAALGLGL